MFGQERIFNMESLIINRKALKHSVSDLKKQNKSAERKPYIAKINGRSFYSRREWLKHLDKCLGLND